MESPRPHDAPEMAQRLRATEAARLRMARLRVAGGTALPLSLGGTCRLAADTLGVERVGIWLFVEGGRALRCFQLYERVAKDHGSEGAVLRAVDFPRYFAALQAWGAIPADDARNDELTAELREAYLEPLGISSMLDAPIYRGGAVVGVVCHETSLPRDWTVEERDFAAATADQVARQLEEAARHDAEARARASVALALEGRRMEALGQLAAGVAHDFGNLLTVIKGFANEVRRQADTPRMTEAAAQILRAVDRGTALTRDLFDFGREERHAPRVLDAAATIEELAPMLRTLASEHRVRIRLEPPVGRVLIDRDQLERVVLNLVKNARDAMPDGGEIAVTVSDVHVPDDPDDDEDRPGVYVVVEVADTGIGMDEATRERIFDPFFSTKSGEAAGIGLAVVYGIVERAGGFIGVDSVPGVGTRMRIYLPRVAAGR